MRSILSAVCIMFMVGCVIPPPPEHFDKNIKVTVVLQHKYPFLVEWLGGMTGTVVKGVASASGVP